MARTRIVDELTGHISDARDAYLSQGLTQPEATAQALLDTGDADIVGMQLDRVHRPKPQWGMLGTTAVLVALGLVVYAYFAGGMSANRLLFTGIGVAGLIAAYFIDFTWLAKHPVPLFIVVVVSSVMLAYAGNLNWAASLTRETGIVFFSRTTSGGAVTLFFPLVLAIVIFHAKGRRYRGVIMFALVFSLLGLVAFHASAVTAMRFVFIGAVILGIAISKGWFKTKKLPAIIIGIAPFALLGLLFSAITIANEFQRAMFRHRIMALFDPSVAPYSRGFWAGVTRAVLRDAAWFGQGGTEGLSMWYHMPLTLPLSVDSASALTTLIGLTGWISFVVIVGVLLFFIIKCMLRCLRQKSSLGMMVSFAILLTIAVQAFEYVLFNLGFQMASPISLPLVVSSNAAFVVNMVLVGFMLSVFRTGGAVVEKTVPHSADGNRLFAWDSGKLTIDFKAITG